MESTIRILYLDDNPQDRELVHWALKQEPRFQITEATTSEEFLALLDNKRFHLLLSDLSLPGLSAMEII